MYHAHFGLIATPFTSQPSATNYVPTPGHEEVLARLEFLAQTQAGCGLLCGAPGSGKSLLLEVFARQCRRQGVAAARISAAGADETELLFGVAAQLGVSLAGPIPAARLVRSLNDRLAELHYEKTGVVVLVDDVDRVSGDRLAVLDSLLAGLASTAWVSVVMAGNVQSADDLSVAMSRRADLRIEVPELEQDEVRQFITTRMARSGCPSTVFDEGAISVIFQASSGNPRQVSQLANLALMAAAANGLTEVDAQMIDEVCRELCVGQP